MRTLSRILVAMLVLLPVAVSAGATPNFSGDWELNVPKSDLGGVPMTKLTVHIEHNDPAFKYTAKATVNGEEFNESETFSTDSKPTQDSRGNTVRAHWEGTTLMIESIAPDGTVLDATQMSLSADGKTMTRDYENKTQPQKRHEIYDKQ